MYKRALIYLTLIGLLLSSCAAASPGRESDGTYYGEVAPAAPPMEAPQAAEGRSPNSGVNVYASSAAVTNRIVIKNVDMSIIVDDPSASLDRISRLAEEMGGFVVSQRAYQQVLSDGQEVVRGSITVRVPAERLNDALERIRSESSKPIVRENIDSQDVTQEYTDLQSRLRNLEAAEAQLQEIMESANRTDDVLSVYNQLTQVREQIEITKGQIQYFEQSSALSSIAVELVPNASVQPLTIAGWEPVGIAKEALQALISGLKGVAKVAIWTVLYALPMLVVVFGPLVVIGLVVRHFWRRRGSKAAPPAQPA
jgi:hypothetical protein